VLKGELQQRVAPAQLQLITDVRPVVLDRAVADAELSGDLFARLVFTDEPEDALLGLREVAQSRFLLGESSGPRAPINEIAGDRRTDVVLAFHSGLDAADDFDDGAVFEHVAPGARVQRLVEDVFVSVHREEDDFDRQTALAHCVSHFKAAHLRHLDVEDGDIGQNFCDERERLLAVVGLADNYHPRLALDDFAQALSEQRMIVGEKDSRLSLHRNSASRLEPSEREASAFPSLSYVRLTAAIMLQTKFDDDRRAGAGR
jgi:hypothetical protein